MSEVRIHLSEQLAAKVAIEAMRMRHTMDKVVETALTTFLDAEDAKAVGLDEERFDAALLEIIVQQRFLVALYDGRVCGVAVDVYETGRLAERSDKRRGTRWEIPLPGKALLISWSSWFIHLCRCSGLELAS